jgi:hypothetical protein
MIKRLCDICGKEIIGLRDRYAVSIDNDCVKAEYFKVIEDVCSDCANSIYHYIEGLKKPLDKLTES